MFSIRPFVHPFTLYGITPSTTHHDIHSSPIHELSTDHGADRGRCASQNVRSSGDNASQYVQGQAIPNLPNTASHVVLRPPWACFRCLHFARFPPRPANP